MKRGFFYFWAVFVIVSTAFVACRKNNDNEGNNNDGTKQITMVAFKSDVNFRIAGTDNCDKSITENKG